MMRRLDARWASIVALTCGLITSSPLAAATLAPLRHTIQLVESRPIETALGDPTLPDAAGVWCAMIDSARTSIDLEQFYVSASPGEALDLVLVSLRRAAARGVRVRLLVDTRMHRTYPQPTDSLAQLPHITVRTLSMGTLGGVQHAKYFIVDGARFFLGSQNFDWQPDQLSLVSFNVTAHLPLELNTDR